jgi:hypothetical protein
MRRVIDYDYEVCTVRHDSCPLHADFAQLCFVGCSRAVVGASLREDKAELWVAEEMKRFLPFFA